MTGAAGPRLPAVARRGLQSLPLLAVLGVFLFAGLRGVDFGDQWDEMEWHVQPVRDMAASGIFLPHAYIYPSLSKWLVLLPAVPAVLSAALNTHNDPVSIQAALKDTLNAPDYRLQARRLFVVISSLAVVWIYAATLTLRQRWWEAFIAAACFGLTWEFSYHARWIANDCILTQFAALTLLFTSLYHRDRRPRWLYAAAIAVGLGTGTKFTGVVLLVAVLGLAVAGRPLRPLRPVIQRGAALCLVAFAAYLVTTPGTALEPFRFLIDGRRISSAYQAGHFGYSVASAFGHWRVVIEYLLFAFFSPSMVVAAVVFVSALAGGFLWVRSDRRMAAVLVGFPLVFLAFFCAQYRVAIVRNYLFVTPFLAVLAGRGLTELVLRLRHRWVRAGTVAAMIAVAAGQAVWLIQAGESIRQFDTAADVRHAIEYVASHSGTKFRLSDRVKALATQQNIPLPANTTDGPDKRAVVLLHRAESPPPRGWKLNDPWLTLAVFGPREVNFDWYASWDSRERVLVMTVEKARGTGIALAQ